MNKSCILSIGNFDGVHLGHQELLKALKTIADQKGYAPVVLTLDPHPIKLLFPERNFKSIFSVEDRVEMIKTFGIKDVEVLKFSRQISQLEPEDFFKKYVLNKFNSKGLIIGYDFNFGKDRKGTIQVAQELCKKYSLDCQVVEAFKINNLTVSSSKIRSYVENGEVKNANLFLGRPFYLSGMVEKGVGRGKQIGVPTANLFTNNELLPQKGVYITLVEWMGKKFKSVTNIGHNPTFIEAGSIIKIETHIFDFDKNIYGEKLKLHFLDRLRDEKKFSSAVELTEQIKLDIKKAREYSWSNY